MKLHRLLPVQLLRADVIIVVLVALGLLNGIYPEIVINKGIEALML